MSKPSAPYYYKSTSDTYHWETSCSNNNFPDDDWKETYTKPDDREQCNQCKSK